VVSVPVYKWALPDNTYPLKGLITAILKGEIEIALFTSGIQVQHVFQLAQSMGKEPQLREALAKVAIGSIGPMASETLQSFGLAPDFEPEHPKMGFLVKAAAERGGDLYKKKFQSAHVSIPTLPSSQTLLFDSLFMKACRKEPTPRAPIWIMRQAGRYLPGYRQVRDMVSFLELCKTPELACEVTVTAQEVLGVDAAILFADILLISEPLGFQLEFVESGGPVIHNPFREASDLARLKEVDVEDDLGYVLEAVRKIRHRLKPNIPLIGFAGAPFTLASYLIESGGTKDYFKTREVLGDIMVWDGLMNRLVKATTDYLNAQIVAGAQAVQLFDSWVGILTPDEFQRLILPYLKTLIKGILPGVPIIYFGTNTEPFFPWLKDTGATVIGVDWHTPLDQAWKKLGDVAIQGNLDPSILLTNPNKIKVEAERILRSVAGKPGHIFNLGHGILPQTPMDNVHALIQTVKEWKN
jgi:uroporphyrinogen decarboxylase